MTNRICRTCCLVSTGLALLVVALLLSRAPATIAAPAAPAGPVDGDPATLVPLGPDQADLYRAYRALFEHLADEGRLRWAQAPFAYGGADYAAGTALVPEAALAGDFDYTPLPSGTLDVRPALAVAPMRIALLRSSVTDDFGDVNWELGAVREVFENYLWGAVPADVLTEEDVRGGALDGYDLLVLPAVKTGTALTVTGALGPDGLAAIAGFVEGGGALYAQGESAFLAQEAGLVPAGTVDLDNRVNDPAQAVALDVALPDHPLALSWITPTLYVLGDPRLAAMGPVAAVATFAGGTQPGSAAILWTRAGAGQVTLVAGHPTDRNHREQVPLFLNALLASAAEQGELYGRAAQIYNPELPPDLLPGWQVVPVSITLSLANLGLEPLGGAVVTETVEPGFVVSETTVVPAPYTITYEVLPGPVTRTHIVWHLGAVAPGQVELSYLARTEPDAMQLGNHVLVSTGCARYVDGADGRQVTVEHFPFRLRAQMAARLEGDRDVELDRAYMIPKEGNYFDVAATLENKEETAALQVVITDVVPLIAPIVALDNQYRVLATDDGETIWMRNEVYFYDDDRYPLPVGYGYTDTVALADWDGTTVYTYTSPGGYHVDPPPGRVITDTGSFVTIPPTYSAYITVTAGHELVLPAAVLTWTAYYETGFPGYEYKEPLIRYGINSRELLSRAVSFTGDPLTGTVVVDATGGSVYTHLGTHPIFYRDYLVDALAYAPRASVAAGVGYRDIWNRTHVLPFRAAFYDVFDWASCVTCPGREQHAAINVTFGLRADTDRDGQRAERVQRVPTRLDRTDLDLLIKSRNLSTAVPWDENLIDEGIFHGLGYRIEPRHGDADQTREEQWQQSYESNFSTMVGFTQTLSTDHLYFQQNLPPGATNLITIQAQILPFAAGPYEGMMKLHDGARLTYRQQWAGPDRYEVYDSHVQGAVGERSDARVRKQVAPIEVSTYGDQIVYLLTVDDPYDPRTFDEDPYLLSYGYGDLAATTYVGGVEKRTLLRSLVSPGDWTRVRVEVNNNSGVTFTNVVLTPQPPAGITLTPLYRGEDAIPPIFWDLPFLWLDTIPDAGRAVYYYSVTVSADLDPALTGTVIEIPVDISGDGVPAYFEVAPAVLAISGEDGTARHTYGQAGDLVVTDLVPETVRLVEAVRVDEVGWDAFQECVALGGEAAACQAGVAPAWPVTVFTETIDAGTWITFALEGDDTLLPRLDGELLHLLVLADLLPLPSGANLVNAGTAITFTDPFEMAWRARSAPVDVEAHGAFIQATYTALFVDNSYGVDYLVPLEENRVMIEAVAHNYGDRKAERVVLTLTLPVSVEVLAVGPGVVVSGQQIVWGGFDLAPGGSSQPVTFAVSIWPPMPAVDRTLPVVAGAWAIFWDEYSAQTIAGPAGGPYALRVGLPPHFIYHRYVPVVLRNHARDWWPDLPPLPTAEGGAP